MVLMLNRHNGSDPVAWNGEEKTAGVPRLGSVPCAESLPERLEVRPSSSPVHRIQASGSPPAGHAADPETSFAIDSPALSASDTSDNDEVSPHQSSPNGGSPHAALRQCIQITSLDSARQATPRTKDHVRAGGKAGSEDSCPNAQNKGGRNPGGIEPDGAWEFDLMNALPRDKALALLDIIEQADRRIKRGDYNAGHFEGMLKEMMSSLQKTMNQRQQRMLQDMREMHDQMRVEVFNMLKAGAESQRQAAASFEGRVTEQLKRLSMDKEQRSRSASRQEELDDRSVGEAAVVASGSIEVVRLEMQHLEELKVTLEQEMRSSSLSKRVEAERAERAKEIIALKERMSACEAMAERTKRLMEKQAQQVVVRRSRGHQQNKDNSEDCTALSTGCSTPQGIGISALKKDCAFGSRRTTTPPRTSTPPRTNTTPRIGTPNSASPHNGRRGEKTNEESSAHLQDLYNALKKDLRRADDDSGVRLQDLYKALDQERSTRAEIARNAAPRSARSALIEATQEGVAEDSAGAPAPGPHDE